MQQIKSNTPFIIIVGLLLLFAILSYTIVSLSDDAPDFQEYQAGTDRKAVFINYFVPILQAQNQEITKQRQQLMAWYDERDDLSWWSELQLNQLADDYDLIEFQIDDNDHWQELMLRVNKIPVSLALAQSAKESGWGTSRFAQQGANFFGQWCYEKGCGMIPNNRIKGTSHEVEEFNSAQQSVAAYLRNLNTHPAYSDLRLTRARLVSQGETVSGLALSVFLSHYSERREAYVKELQSMIRYNQLSQYDEHGTETMAHSEE